MPVIASKNVTEKVELESSPCPMGCPSGDEHVLTGRDRLHDLPGKFNVVKCKTCGLMRTNPRPTQDSIGFYYPETYGPWTPVPKNKSAVISRPLPAWKQIIKDLILGKPLALTPPLPPGKMLEIGCGNGSFMHSMAIKGWRVQGIESSQKAGEAIKELGYPVYIGPLESAPAPKEPVDLIVGWHVLEHLHHPLQSLKMMKTWLKPGGCLALSMPNTASFEFKWFMHRWYALHLPNHLYHFDPKTVENLLKASGWKMEQVAHEINIGNLFGSAGYFLQDTLGAKNSLANYMANFPARDSQFKYYLTSVVRAFAYFGQTGRMVIWAKRLED